MLYAFTALGYFALMSRRQADAEFTRDDAFALAVFYTALISAMLHFSATLGLAFLPRHFICLSVAAAFGLHRLSQE